MNDDAACQLGLRAANMLAEHYREAGRYIQAWDEIGAEDEGGRAIIDTMMNLALLYWASHQTGDSRYAEIASNHASTTADYLIREDGSSYHTFFLIRQRVSPLVRKRTRVMPMIRYGRGVRPGSSSGLR